MPVSLDKTPRRFTIAYTDDDTFPEIRRVLTGVVNVGDPSNQPWTEVSASGLEWFSVTAISAGDALLKGRAELTRDMAADPEFLAHVAANTKLRAHMATIPLVTVRLT